MTKNGIDVAHRSEVAHAARTLGTSLIEVDIDARPDEAKAYNVPAVAVAGAPESLIAGAHPSQVLVERLRPYFG